MIITVANVEERTASNNRRFWTVKSTAGGSWNVFDPKFKDLTGQTIEIAVKQNGKFENIELLRTGVAPEPKPVVPTTAGSTFVGGTFQRDVERIKGTSMSYSKDIVCALIAKGLDEPALIVKTLDFYYRFFKDTLMDTTEAEAQEEALLEE